MLFCGFFDFLFSIADQSIRWFACVHRVRPQTIFPGFQNCVHAAWKFFKGNNQTHSCLALHFSPIFIPHRNSFTCSLAPTYTADDCLDFQLNFNFFHLSLSRTLTQLNLDCESIKSLLRTRMHSCFRLDHTGNIIHGEFQSLTTSNDWVLITVNIWPTTASFDYIFASAPGTKSFHVW